MRVSYVFIYYNINKKGAKLSNNSLNTYFKSIKRFPLLTKQQEIELAKKIEKGDKEAKRLMIQSNLRLAISIAKKYAKYGHDIEDLIQESNLGLMKAIDKFDWRKGFKFSTYASWWIKQAATRSLTVNNSILKIPSHTIANTRKVWQVIKDYQEEFNVDPTVEEISDLLALPITHVKQAMDAIEAKHVLSIDKPFNDGNTKTLADIIPDRSSNIEEALDNEYIRNQIILAFKKLTKREELILRLRFGIHETLVDDENIYEV
tara:strand:- start:4258 stop:5040 length:783 start_codon:yes stop_codon:yes gene_type:complete